MAGSSPLVDDAAQFAARNNAPGRNLPRHLRTHDALTVGVPFLPGASRHSRLFPRQSLATRNSCEKRRYNFDATPGSNIYSKRLSLLPDPPATALSGCLDRYDSASVSWGDACPIGFFAASGLVRRFCLRSIFCQRRAVSAPIPGGSLQPLDRQSRYYRLPSDRASAPSFHGGTSVTASRRLGAQGRIRPPSGRLHCSKRTKRHSFEWRFASLRWSLASQQIMGGGYLHRAFYRLSRPVLPLVGGCSCRASAVFAGWPEFSPAAGTSLAPC